MRSTLPVPVMVAGTAIIATRCLSLLLLAYEPGYDETVAFLHRSAQTWEATLTIIASQLIFFVELRCAFMLMRGANGGRWGYAATQILVLLYMLAASLGWAWPVIFSISGETSLEIIHTLILQKFPDMVVLLLLFVPASSRQFFRKE